MICEGTVDILSSWRYSESNIWICPECLKPFLGHRNPKKQKVRKGISFNVEHNSNIIPITPLVSILFSIIPITPHFPISQYNPSIASIAKPICDMWGALAPKR